MADDYTQIMALMDSEGIGFTEAKARIMTQKCKNLDVKQEIQTIALKARRDDGSFIWKFGSDFQYQLKMKYPDTNYNLDEIERICDELVSEGILHRQTFDDQKRPKYVFERKNLQ
ncbi:hypothetical protein [Methanococcoides sp. FTZ1]|uniref:hypothetical protein n=1 Tax=Methanococcoides sp. FTZ1 TaxID=3439061 RepID=UPI003F865446